MVCFPNAKINIGLNITEKRPDGYHTIQSLFYPVPLCDLLEVVEDKKGSGVIFTGSGLTIPGGGINLCEKAYQLINQDYPLPPVRIHLHKIIPIGAGLGGGSADAAFFIQLLNNTFEIGLSWGEMHHYARLIGSDCSFFLSNRPAFVEGRGDEYEPINVNLAGFQLVIVYPNLHINTAEAYRGVTPMPANRSLENDCTQATIEEWKHLIKNDFEKSVFVKYPLLSHLKEQLYSAGAVYASMSGSGSSIYGLFKQTIDAPSLFPNYFTWQGKL